MLKAIIIGGAVILGVTACAPTPTQILDPWILLNEGDPVPQTNDVRIDIALLKQFGLNYQERCDWMGGTLNYTICEDVDN